MLFGKPGYFFAVALCCCIATLLLNASGTVSSDLPNLSHWFEDVEGGTQHHAYVLRFHVLDGVNRAHATDEIIGLIRKGNSSEQKLGTELRSVSLRERGLRDQDVLALALSQLARVPCDLYEFDDPKTRDAKIATLLDVVDRNQTRTHRLLFAIPPLVVIILFLALFAFKKRRSSSKVSVR